MNNDYKILGLEQGASQADIKKAYFKMVRLHSPESDPEQFQKIRKAYEHLKDAQTKPDGPVFPPLSNPQAIKMMQQIQLYRKEKNIIRYRDCCEEAWKKFPDDIHFLYLLIMAQRRCGNTGKAVKNAELLVSKDPNNKWYQMALAFSYQERGYWQKALSACEKAFFLGCRDIDFLLMYAGACDDYNDSKKGVQVLSEIVHKKTRWAREEVPKVAEAFSGMLAMYGTGSDLSLLEILEMLYSFLTQYIVYLKEFTPQLCLILSNACVSVTYGSAEYQKADAIFSYIQKSCTDFLENELIATAIENFHFHRALCDSRLSQQMLAYLELFHDYGDDEEDPLFKKFAMLDTQLMLLEQREDTLRQAEIIRTEHPQEYPNIEDFVKKLENPAKVLYEKERMLKTYQRLEPYYMCGYYYDAYPQEKNRVIGTIINEDIESEPYMRINKKIGRNDPCPCGSGKKYKHCCMPR